MTFNMQSTGTL